MKTVSLFPLCLLLTHAGMALPLEPFSPTVFTAAEVDKSSKHPAGPAPAEAGAAVGTQSDRYSKSFYSMGTLFEITIRITDGIERSPAESVVKEAFETIARLDTLLSTYKPYSEISGINRRSGGEFLEVDPLVIAVIDSSMAYWEITEGAFDITVGPLLELWGLKGREPRVPDSALLPETIRLVDASSIEIDRARGAVRLKKAGQSVDLGGIGKGFALDRAAEVLRGAGIAHAMLNAGGSLLVMGESSPGETWKAGIVHPRSPGEIIARFSASNVAVSTSGDYEDYFISDNTRYSHILDPRTGVPTSNLISATVIAPTATGADALSTAIVVMGLERGMELVESLHGVEAVLVTGPDREDHALLDLSVSSGLGDRIEIVRGARRLTLPRSGR